MLQICKPSKKWLGFGYTMIAFWIAILFGLFTKPTPPIGPILVILFLVLGALSGITATVFGFRAKKCGGVTNAVKTYIFSATMIFIITMALGYEIFSSSIEE